MTQTWLGYFAVALAWMAGVVLNLRYAVLRSLAHALGGSIAAYYALVSAAHVLRPGPALVAILAVSIGMAGAPGGAFFRELARSVAARSLFLHENNGFVLGYILSMVGFVKWGVNFLYVAPGLSFGVAFLCARGKCTYGYALLAVAGGVCGLLRNPAAAWTLAVAAALGLALFFVPASPVEEPGEPAPRELRWHRVVLAIAGCNLILLQFAITREFSSILGSSELTILIVAAAYFTGYSVGYFASRWLSVRPLSWVGVVMFVLQFITLPTIKVVGAWFLETGHSQAATLGLLFMASFGTSAFYSVLLPVSIRTLGNESLGSLYSWDLLGGAVGAGTLFVMVAEAPSLLWPLYFSLMLALLGIAFGRRVAPFLSLGVFAIGVLTVHQTPLAIAATEDFYRLRGYPNPRLLYARSSLYHNVEVIDTFDDAGRTQPARRTSFLNGVRYFSHGYDAGGHFSPGPTSSRHSEFTYFMSELPARYLFQKAGRKLRCLVMGCGSMQTLHALEPYSSWTTMIDIDPSVIDAAQKCWQDFNHYDQVAHKEIIVDDVRRFLATTDQRFDLIVMDISAPYYLATSLLHNEAFFELARSRLDPGGVFVDSTQGRPYADEPNCMGMKILRALVDVFPHYRVLDCEPPRASHGYVYASSDCAFSSDDLSAIIRRDGATPGTFIYEEGSPHFRFEGTIPYSMTNMETLLSNEMRSFREDLGLEGRVTATNPDSRHLEVPDVLRDILQGSGFWTLLAVAVLVAIGARGRGRG